MVSGNVEDRTTIALAADEYAALTFSATCLRCRCSTTYLESGTYYEHRNLSRTKNYSGFFLSTSES